MRISDWSSDVCSSDLAAPFDPDVARRNRGIELAQRGAEFILYLVDRRFGFNGQRKMSDEAGPLCDPLPLGNQPIFRCAVLEAGRTRGLSIAQRTFEHHQEPHQVLAKGKSERRCEGK